MLARLMCCLNGSVAGYECIDSVDCNAATAECTGAIDSADSFHPALQNEMENSEMSCSGGGCCYWTVPKTGTYTSVRRVPGACFPRL